MLMKKMMVAVLALAIPCMMMAKSSDESYGYGDGETLEAGQDVSFTMEDAPESIGGYDVLTEYLPETISVEWTGKKFKCPKAGRVKYSKKDEGFVATNDENPCGFKVSVNKKTGRIKGSFKVYCQKSEKKLKAYSAKFSGYLGGSVVVSIKGAGTFSATFE